MLIVYSAWLSLTSHLNLNHASIYWVFPSSSSVSSSTWITWQGVSAESSSTSVIPVGVSDSYNRHL
jgi:hypothetical protein